MSDWKLCQACDFECRIEDFWTDRAKLDQLQSYCKECHAEKSGAWMRKARAANPEKYKEQSRSSWRAYKRREAARK